MKCFHASVSELRTVDARDALIPIDRDKIYWHINEKYLTQDMDKQKVILAFEKTFQTWQEYFYPVRLVSTGNREKAAIVIYFMNNGMSELPFRFENSVLAYTFYPKKKSLGIESDMYFNDAHDWAEMHRKTQINLYKVAVHEVGHAFGLDHSRDVRDIMFPTYQPNDSVVITLDTEKAIDKLYGRLKEKLTAIKT